MSRLDLRRVVGGVGFFESYGDSTDSYYGYEFGEGGYVADSFYSYDYGSKWSLGGSNGWSSVDQIWVE